MNRPQLCVPPAYKDQLVVAFDALDENADGKLPKSALKVMLRGLSYYPDARRLERAKTAAEAADDGNDSTTITCTRFQAAFTETVDLNASVMDPVDVARAIDAMVHTAKPDGRVRVNNLRHAVQLCGLDINDESLAEMIAVVASGRDSCTVNEVSRFLCFDEVFS